MEKFIFTSVSSKRRYRICSMGLSAFSLIEVLIAIGILSVGLIGAIRVFPVGLRASHRAELLSRAVLAAEGQIEAIRLKDSSKLKDESFSVSEDPFNIIVKVDSPASLGLLDPSRIKRVLVDVSWFQENKERSIKLGTYIYRSAL
jgi:prepilin-type N-terminal cleavage/methylation domain-containing protein